MSEKIVNEEVHVVDVEATAVAEQTEEVATESVEPEEEVAEEVE